MTDSTVIETWKLELERLLWSYHENGRPDGKTGVIGNPKTIQEFVIKLMDRQYKMGKQDGWDMGFVACEENNKMGRKR